MGTVAARRQPPDRRGHRPGRRDQLRRDADRPGLRRPARRGRRTRGAGQARGPARQVGPRAVAIFQFTFMVNAYRAGTIVAVLAGALGWFMVLRRQSFAGHTLALVSFPGAAAAIFLGISVTIGYFAAAIPAPPVIAAVPPPPRGPARGSESAIIGTV